MEPSVKAKKLLLHKKPVVRKLHFDDSVSNNCDESQLGDELDSIKSNDECLMCGEFGREKEMWYRCVMCFNWAHSKCSGWDSPVIYDVSKHTKRET